MSEPYKTIEAVKMNDAAVRQAFVLGMLPSEIIVMLVNQKDFLLRKIEKLEAIAPRKITYDGKTYIWRCPDELL